VADFETKKTWSAKMKTTVRELWNFYRPLLMLAGVLMLIGLALVGCTSQTPATNAPVYNVTYTDQSTIVIGDGSSATTRTESRTDARTDLTTQQTTAQTKESWGWIWWVIALLAVVSGGVYLVGRKKRWW
jgi:hypothetical protein